MSGYVQQGTDVGTCFTSVEQEYLSPGTDVKTLSGSKLVLITQRNMITDVNR